jgi:hypothetical protein
MVKPLRRRTLPVSDGAWRQPDRGERRGVSGRRLGPTRGAIGVRRAALALLAMLLADPRSADAGNGRPRVTISGPASLVGDGAQRVQLRVQIAPARATAESSRLVLRASAGVLGEVVHESPGVFAVEYTAARVAVSTEVTVGPKGSGFDVTPFRFRLEPPAAVGSLRRTGGRLDLAVPDHVVLGGAAEAPLSASKTDATLHVSAGSLGAVGPVGGRLQATWRMPAEKYPRLAIVAAIGPASEEIDWTTVPLHGRPEVRTESEPESLVRIQVGAVEFGPVLADEHGTASLAVEAPPGLHRVLARSTAPSGAHRDLELPLEAPPAGQLFAVCRPSPSALLVFTIDDAGRPRRGMRLQTRASGGSLSPATEIEPGVYQASFAPPDAFPGGHGLVLQAWPEGSDGPPATCTLEVPPGVAATPAPAPAAEPKRRFRAALRGGVLTNFGRIVAPLVAGGLDVRLPIADENLTAGLTVGYYGSSSSGPDSSGQEQIELAVWAVPLAARLAYEVPIGIVRLYVGGEAGLLVAGTTVRSPTTGERAQTDPQFLGGGLLGGDVALGPGQVALEASYAYSPAAAAGVTGNFAGLGITAGYRYDF